MINELGEEIPEERVREIGRRIARLSEEKIDELFREIGFVVSEYEGKGNRPKGYRALFPGQIQEIKNNKGRSSVVRHLLLETPKKRVLDKLQEIE